MMLQTPLRVHVIRPFGPFELEVPSAVFSTSLPIGKADALLCEWKPTDAMLRFDGPSAWYTAEPRTNPRIGVLAHRDQRRFLSRLGSEQLLHHAHDDRRFRVPHMTHASLEPSQHRGPRANEAAAVVSNFGGPVWNRGPDVRLRNAFATAPGVALFGRRAKWRYYRRVWWARRGEPDSYRGEVDDVASDKIELLARYHTTVCLENTCEPWYFSEKFVDAARAGCVPVYHAHPTVRDSVLSGASWVDPADHDFDVGRTLRHALDLDRRGVDEQNRSWLRSEAVGATSEHAVWDKIGRALRAQA